MAETTGSGRERLEPDRRPAGHAQNPELDLRCLIVYLMLMYGQLSFTLTIREIEPC